MMYLAPSSARFTIRVRGDLHLEAVGFNDLVENGLDHIEIVLADIRQRHLDIVKLRYAQNIGKELFL